MRKIPYLFAVVTALAVSFVGMAAHAEAAPATFTVINTNDSGAGSLRQAIIDANENANPSDMDVIEFTIAGGGVKTITPLTALPAITEKVMINGYSQPGASANTAVAPNPLNGTILIEIDGANLTGDGAQPGEASGLRVNADNSIVKGLSVFGFGGIFDGVVQNGGVVIFGNSIKVQGNYLGVRANGITEGSGRIDAALGLVGNNALVGGTNPEDRNILFGRSQYNTAATVFTVGTGAEFYGNYLGLAKDGVTDLSPEAADANGFNPPFVIGINFTNGGGNTLGGVGAGKINVIAGSTANVVLSSSNNTVQGNYIGTDYTGAPRNGITNGIGVTSTLGDANIVGGVQAGEGNTIAGVLASAVNISSFSLPAIDTVLQPTRMAVLGNKIYDIGVFSLNTFGNSNLGIDIARYADDKNPPNYSPNVFEAYGPTPNDTGDTDTGPNNYMNTPVLKTAKQVGNQLTITYDLDVADSPSNQYRVEFFSNDASTIFGAGPGQELIGTVTTSAGTNKTATLTVATNEVDKALSATATAVDGTSPTGFGATSEFARNISIGSPTDTDADGVTDVIEEGAPNSGDGNNDGTDDSLQATVTSFKDATNTDYITFVVTGCRENSNVAVLAQSEIGVKDNGYSYPFGLTGFTLNCSRGDTANVVIYTYSDLAASGLMARKFDDVNNQFISVPNASITSDTIGGEKVIRLAYSVKDGSSLDDDGTENGLIVDPIGLASESTLLSSLPRVGVPYWFLPVPLALFFMAIYIIWDWRRHRKPLIEQDPTVRYTIWHHLRVVTIPLFKYRISFVVSRPTSHGPVAK